MFPSMSHHTRSGVTPRVAHHDSSLAAGTKMGFVCPCPEIGGRLEDANELVSLGYKAIVPELAEAASGMASTDVPTSDVQHALSATGSHSKANTRACGSV